MKDILFILVGGMIYFAPTFVAAIRNHRNAVAIMILNFFLGWTFIGWVIALIWSVMNDKTPQS